MYLRNSILLDGIKEPILIVSSDSGKYWPDASNGHWQTSDGRHRLSVLQYILTYEFNMDMEDIGEVEIPCVIEQHEYHSFSDILSNEEYKNGISKRSKLLKSAHQDINLKWTQNSTPVFGEEGNLVGVEDKLFEPWDKTNISLTV
jgi:hypothetical protein